MNLDGTLILQVYDPFAAFLTHYKNTYLEDRRHSAYGGSKQTEIICEKGKEVADTWYDFGGNGVARGVGKVRNHPGCVSKKQGSFFDHLPCPCNRLTYGLSAKNFES